MVITQPSLVAHASACKGTLVPVVRRFAPSDSPALHAMYESFEPCGGPLGLPPPDPERRIAWLACLHDGLEFVAFADGILAGHLVLLPEGHEAELVCFVHQDYRRQGVATTLARAAVETAGAAGIAAIWVLIDNTNAAARQGLLKFGFRPAWEDRIESKFVYTIPPR